MRIAQGRSESIPRTTPLQQVKRMTITGIGQALSLCPTKQPTIPSGWVAWANAELTGRLRVPVTRALKGYRSAIFRETGRRSLFFASVNRASIRDSGYPSPERPFSALIGIPGGLFLALRCIWGPAISPTFARFESASTGVSTSSAYGSSAVSNSSSVARLLRQAHTATGLSCQVPQIYPRRFRCTGSADATAVQ